MPVANVVAQVAKIGSTQYASLQEAFDAVADGQTITLTANITQDDGFKFDRAGVSAKLNLNKKTLTVNKGDNVNSRAIRIDNGTLEVYDGTINAVGSGTTSTNGTGCYGAFRVEANGKLVAKNLTLSNARPFGLNVKVLGGEAELTNVTISSSYGGGIEVTEANLGTHSKKGKATLTNCTFTQTGYFDHCSTTLSVSGGSELVVNSGSYTSENYVIYVFSSGGDVTVNGGNFTATGSKAAFKAAIDTNTYPEYTGGMKLNDGNFVGKFEITSPASTVVTGGIYTADVTAYMPTDATKAQNTDGSYTINPVAVVNGINYSTLADAIAAVPTDGTATTITMIADEAVVAGVTIAAGQNVVLELNGKTISGNTESNTTYALITNRGTLTIQDNTDTNKDGTGTGLITTYISNPDGGNIPGYASNTITNNGTLTVKSGKIVNNGNGYACYAIDSQTNGNLYTPVLNIEGGRMEQMNAKTYAVRMFCNSTTNTNSLNVSGGVITGGYGLWLQTPNNKANMASLNITGGTIEARDGAALYIGGTKADDSKISIDISGGEIKGTGVKISGPLSGTYGHVSISGGEIENVQCGDNVEDFISGGTFVEPVIRDLCVSGKKCVEGDNGEYIIVDESDERESAAINTVLYYWLNSDNSKGGGYYNFYAPFEGPDPVLMDGEFVELKDNVILTKDVTYLTECSFGDPIYKGGTFTLTFGEYNIDLNGFKFPIPAGVTVKTDKQTDIFSAAEGYKIVETAVEGGYTYTVTELPSVAKIGETKYASLAEAVAAAQNGETVTLLADVTLTDRLFVNAGATPAYAGTGNRYATTAENKSITLELDGHNITCNSNIALAGGSLNITNTGTADATHGVISTTDAGSAPVEIRGTGDLTAKRTLTVGTGVTLTGSKYGLNVFGSNDAQKNIIDVNVNGTVNGTLFVLGNLKNIANEININVNGTIYVPNNDNNSAEVGIALNGNATVTVNEGANVSGETGIEVRAGKLDVNGGTIKATASTYSYTANNSGSSTKGAAIAVAQHTTVLPITTTLNGGTLTGGEKTLVVEDAQNNDLSSVEVTATESFTQSAVIPEGFKWKATGENTYTLVEDKFILVDGTDYTKTADEPVAKAVYKRTFGSNRVKKYQGWFIPFDYTITAADLQKFKFFKIDMIAHSAVPGEAGDPNKLWVHLIQLKEGDVMKANKPYIFTPQEEVGEYEFITTNATLKALTTESVASCSTMSEEFNFYGVYSPIHPVAEDTDIFYYMALSGQLSYATKTSTTVGANRWIFRVTPKSGQESRVAYSIGFVVNGEVEDDDVTAVSSATAEAEGEVVGYYTLNGQKVSEPTKGVYVVKYANGTSKKVVF